MRGNDYINRSVVRTHFLIGGREEEGERRRTQETGRKERKERGSTKVERKENRVDFKINSNIHTHTHTRSSISVRETDRQTDRQTERMKGRGRHWRHNR